MAVWTLVKKELRLLVRDRLALVLLLAMPLIFILILGLLLGEGFGQKPDDRLRISLVDQDQGLTPVSVPGAVGLLAAPGTGPLLAVSGLLAGQSMFPGETWSQVVRRDLAETADIRLEVIPSLDEARQLVAAHRRAAVLVFHPGFSLRLYRCSFLSNPDPDQVARSAAAGGGLAAAPAGWGPLLAVPVLVEGGRYDRAINPFHRDGVYLDRVDAELLTDPMQPGANAIIDQVGQVSLLRVVLPWMIGRAFERLSDPEFIHLLGDEVRLPVPKQFQFLMRRDRIRLGELLNMASAGNPRAAREYNEKVGEGVQAALREQFRKYNLRGKTWAALTRSQAHTGGGAEVSAFRDQEGAGPLKRGAQRYQILVPSYTVLFAFFLVLIVGWVFVAERRQGTLTRLRLAPLTRAQILLGKLAPCFLVSVGQGLFLLLAGRLFFGMRWGPEQWPLIEQVGWLLPVVCATSLAAMGLALLVAALARTEMQVALYGAVPVLVLALVGGCVLPREMMPESTQALTLITPQGWALDAYRELLGGDPRSLPNLHVVLKACGVLAGFGTGFLALAWGLLRLD